MKFSTCFSSKSIDLVSAIISKEDLDVILTVGVNALGDTVIEAEGSKEDISILKEIYQMVGGN